MNDQHQEDIFSLHGTMVSVSGIGVLLTGKPGIGKSKLALELLDRGHQLISDDCINLAVKEKKIVASCPIQHFHFIFIRDIGMINVTKIFGEHAYQQHTTLDFIAHLSRQSQLTKNNDNEGVQFHPNFQRQNILGVEIPKITINLESQHNPALFLETLIKNESLKNLGYDAHQDFLTRITT